MTSLHFFVILGKISLNAIPDLVVEKAPTLVLDELEWNQKKKII